MKKKLFLFATMFLFTGLYCFSQQKKSLGIDNNWNYDNYNVRGRYGIGISYEHQITKHSGYETGLFYKSQLVSSYVIVSATPSDFQIRENYLSLPIQYKYFSSIINISLGANLDYYIGWDDVDSNIKILSYNTSDKFNYGLMAKVSKSITVLPNIVVEPDIRINQMLNHNRFYYGVGLSIKYIFTSVNKAMID